MNSLKEKYLYPILIEVLLWIFYLLKLTFNFVSSASFKSFEKNLHKDYRRANSEILLFWHNQLILVFFTLLRTKDLNMCIMISANSDGDFMSLFLNRIGCRVIRGSSNTKSISVLRKMHKFIKLNSILGYAADGPTGPKYEFKPGAIFLSKKYKIPITLIHIKASNFFELNTWDKLKVPLPFSKLKITFKQLEPSVLYQDKPYSNNEDLLRSTQNILQDHMKSIADHNNITN